MLDVKARTICTATIALDVEDSVERLAPGRAPIAFRIWHAGTNDTDMGPHEFSEASAKAIIEQQSERGNLFSIDVDHLSLNETAPPEARKAVGWHRLEVRTTAAGPELWAVDVQWTEAVRGGLEKTPPEWRYFSPAYRLAKDSSEIDGYLNTALTNNPATHFVTALASRRIAATKGTAMADEKNEMTLEDAMAALDGDDKDKKEEATKCVAAWRKAAFPEPKKEEEAAAEKDPEDPGSKEKKGETKEEPEARRASAVTASAAPSAREMALVERILKLEKRDEERAAQEVARKDAEERATIFAKRPDIDSTVRATLEALPIADLRKLVEKYPRVRATSQSSVNAATPGAQEREEKPTYVPRLSEDEQRILAKLDRGRAAPERASMTGHRFTTPFMDQAQAKKVLADLEKENV